jgi:hypothetical protein
MMEGILCVLRRGLNAVGGCVIVSLQEVRLHCIVGELETDKSQTTFIG